MIDCDTINQVLASRQLCERSPYGARIETQCLFPSASQVSVHVHEWKDGFRVTDAGAASDYAATCGRETSSVLAALREAARRFDLSMEGDELFAVVPSKEWLPAAIMAVANGAAYAANLALEAAVKSHEQTLKDQINQALIRTIPEKYVARGYEFVGKSGKHWHLDYAVTLPNKPMLIKAVSPHHNSVAATYTTFGDLRDDANQRFAVFRSRPQNEDAALLRQVSDLISVTGLSDNIGAILGVRFH